MHLRPGVAKQPNLELKTQPKKLLGSLPLVIALPDLAHDFAACIDCTAGFEILVLYLHLIFFVTYEWVQ